MHSFSINILICIPMLIFVIFYCHFLRKKLRKYRRKLDDALHKKAEITNFLTIFSRTLRSVDEIDSAMNVAARYVADIVEAESVCIFKLQEGYLKPQGVSGPFPSLVKMTEAFEFTKSTYLLNTLKQDKIEVGKGIIGGVAKAREALFIKDAYQNNELMELKSQIQILSLMAVPFLHEGEVKGIVCAINNRKHNIFFSREQFSLLRFTAPQLVLAQNLTNLYVDLQRQERLEQELHFAEELQSELLPKSFPNWEQFQVEAFCRPAKEVAGDFYDFIEIDEDRMLVVVGDACGKGIPACMLMSMTRSFLRSNASRFTTLNEMLIELNANIYRDSDEERFITLACCLLDKKNATVEYGRAGHTELLIYVRKHIRKIFPEGPALGLFPPEIAEFDTVVMSFAKEMDILLFSDGITEALNTKSDEFGIDKLCNTFKHSCINHTSPRKVLDSIVYKVDDFTEGMLELGDDQTLLIIRHKEI